MQRGDQHAGREADRFHRIVVLDLAAVLEPAILLGKYRDEPGSTFEERLALVRPERGERVEPLAGRPVPVEVAFLLFGGGPDSPLGLRVADHDEVPGLKVRAAWRGGRGLEAVVDDRPRHRAAGEVPDSAPARELRVELARPLRHLVLGVLPVARERHEERRVHLGFRSTRPRPSRTGRNELRPSLSLGGQKRQDRVVHRLHLLPVCEVAGVVDQQ